jgi:hypothetical protein
MFYICAMLTQTSRRHSLPRQYCDELVKYIKRKTIVRMRSFAIRNVTFIFFVNSGAMLSKFSAMEFYNIEVKYIISGVHNLRLPGRRGYYILNHGDKFYATELNACRFSVRYIVTLLPPRILK